MMIIQLMVKHLFLLNTYNLEAVWFFPLKFLSLQQTFFPNGGAERAVLFLLHLELWMA